jgi:ATP-dependent helicase Lhr and Lhr-like helicase
MARPPAFRFQPAVAEWFAETFPGPTRAQELGWPEIQAGRSTLVFAPTGSGKTLAAFLAAIDRLMFAPVPAEEARTRIVYVSPLRALAVDVERNLRAPLAGIARTAGRRGDAVHLPTVGIRTGDTPANERTRMLRHPPDILITTPESLFLLLTSRSRATLAPVETVIVDEIHALVPTKRGAHLALSLERLQEITGRPLQRIGLSATQRPLEEVARFLGGGEGLKTWKPRPVSIVDAGSRKAFDLKVEVPVEDMAKLGQVLNGSDEIPEGDASSAQRRSIWPAMHPRLLELIRAHRSTLVFVNSRRLAERLAGALNELAGEELARAHHGSIAREQRIEMEDALKSGRLPCMVATSSLELGIDMGAIDLVVQVETPPSVASGIQRIGRAGHQAGAVSRGIIFPKYRGDLLSTAAITRAMQEGAVEATRIPQNPLDVLAQQLVALSATGEHAVDDLYRLVRRSAPFARLPRTQFEGVLDMLSGRYPSDEFAELRPRLTWDRLRGQVRGREGALKLAVVNAGTIPDRGLFGVFLADDGARAPGRREAGRRVGELDEEMVFESREGEVFVLGASSWRIVEITRDRVLVEPAPGQPGRMPFWKGDRAARPVEMGALVGRLTRELLATKPDAAQRRLVADHALTDVAAENLVAYLHDQKQAAAVPDDRTIVLERTRDEMGDWRLCLLSPWGGRVHAPWALALSARLRKRGESEVETVWTDDGIVIRLPDREVPPDAAALLPEPDEIEDLVLGELGGTALFASHFREAAGRALLLPRRRPGLRSPLWMQRKRAHDLLSVASRYGSFPIILEAYREVLQDVFDLPGFVDLARKVQRRELRLVTVDTAAPSPFAASLLFGYVANFLYEGDAPLAERRAQALSVDQAQLRELLGEAELRELLDPEALADVEASRQGLQSTQRLKSPDRLHDLLLRIGDLSLDELGLRVEETAGHTRETAARTLADALLLDRRAIRVTIAGNERLIASEDAGRYRDALGIVPPPGLPDAFLQKVPDALAQLVARYARGHGPFAATDVAHRLGTGESPATEALERLREQGRVLEGEFRPGGHGREWVDPDVLATLRRRSLARLRKQVEPAPPAALARLMLEWQGVVTRRTHVRRGPDALLDVVEQLQGASIPASVLERDVLPARLPEYRSQDLDLLTSAGEVIWVGLQPLGDRDGRMSLFLADSLHLLYTPPSTRPRSGPSSMSEEGLRPDERNSERHQRLREHLERHGASFFAELLEATGSGLAQAALEALWDLVWAGEVTNDAPEALRAFLRPASSSRRRPGAFRSRRVAPPSGAGRWSLVARARAGKAPSTTERAKALGEQLLSRHGILTRQAALAENVPGGFATLYPLLRGLEEAGRIRRGYFLAGLGGSQFALPGALERLRTLRDGSPDDPASAVIASTDPANPYGAALPWPKEGAGRAMRAAGTHVALVDGELAAYLGKGEREITPYLPEDEPQRSERARALARVLARWTAQTDRRALGWSLVAGEPIARSVLAPFLLEAGFVPSGPGLRLPSQPEGEPPPDPDAEPLGATEPTPAD